MHNMIVEDEELEESLDQNYLQSLSTVTIKSHFHPTSLGFERFARSIIDIQQEASHYKLQEDLIQYLWEFKENMM